jgi:hypothetical protein
MAKLHAGGMNDLEPELTTHESKVPNSELYNAKNAKGEKL